MRIPPIVPVLGGLTLLLLLALQVAIGKRWIRLGRDHLAWHRRIAFGMLALAVLHGAAAYAMLYL